MIIPGRKYETTYKQKQKNKQTNEQIQKQNKQTNKQNEISKFRFSVSSSWILVWYSDSDYDKILSSLVNQLL